MPNDHSIFIPLTTVIVGIIIIIPLEEKETKKEMDQQPGYSAPYCIIFLRAFSEKGLQSPAEGSFPTFSKLIAIIARAFIQVPTTVSGRKGQRQRHTTYIYISWCEARED